MWQPLPFRVRGLHGWPGLAGISDERGLPPCRHPSHSRLAGAALSGFLRALPVPAPVNRGRRHHGQSRKAHGLAPVVHPAMVFAPCGLLGVADQIGARDGW
jgi:hypothetical protein